MDKRDFNEIKSLLLDVREMQKKLIVEIEKELLTPKEVQKILKIGKTTYQRYMENKVFKQIKIEGKAYVQRSEIERLIEEGKV